MEGRREEDRRKVNTGKFAGKFLKQAIDLYMDLI